MLDSPTGTRDTLKPDVETNSLRSGVCYDQRRALRKVERMKTFEVKLDQSCSANAAFELGGSQGEGSMRDCRTPR